MLLNLKRLIVGESDEVCVEKDNLAVFDGLADKPAFRRARSNRVHHIGESSFAMNRRSFVLREYGERDLAGRAC